jgi:hypothetical protein
MYAKGPALVHHCLLNYGAPANKKFHSIVDAIVILKDGASDPQHPNHGICKFPALMPGEKRLITKIQLLYAHNDQSNPVRFHVWASSNKLGTLDIPANVSSPLMPDQNGRLVYEPKLVHLVRLPVMHYLGFEEQIMSEARTWAGTHGAICAHRTLAKTDPLLIFLRTCRIEFDELSAEDTRIIAQADDSAYLVSEALVSRAQRLFQQVMEMIHYLPEDCAHLSLVRDGEQQQQQQQGTIMLMLQLDYVSVYPGGAWTCNEIKLPNFIYAEEECNHECACVLGLLHVMLLRLLQLLVA